MVALERPPRGKAVGRETRLAMLVTHQAETPWLVALAVKRR